MTWKKGGLLALALLMVLVSNLHLYYSVRVGDTRLDGLYSKEDLRRSLAAAEAAAEELLPGPPSPPQIRKSARLSLRPAAGDTRALTGTLLCAYPGVVLADGVFVNGVRLGTVADGQELSRRLRESILAQMPNAAVFGNISGQLQIHPVYSVIGHETSYDDMILLICGMAPVIYVDGEGKLA